MATRTGKNFMAKPLIANQNEKVKSDMNQNEIKIDQTTEGRVNMSNFQTQVLNSSKN